MTLSITVTCPVCRKPQRLTLAGKFRVHGPRETPCDMSGCFLPAELQRPVPQSAIDADKVLPGRPAVPLEAPCPPSPTTNPKSSDATDPVGSATCTTDSTSDTTPETDTPPTISLPSQSSGPTTEYDRPDPINWEQRTNGYEQPDNKVKPPEYNPLAEQVTATVREIFYQYTNRSRRSQQKTLGPSEIGTPCDRRLVMRMLGAEPVNPGGDNWASWVGTQIHAGLDEMFRWADTGKGRFSTEMKIQFASTIVPGGTLDLLDRVLLMVDDHKCMGQRSLDKLRQRGPTPLYRKQVHLYAYGAVQRGEKVEHVCIIAWPREESSLDNLYVWTEPYNPSVAIKALARVERLKKQVDDMQSYGTTDRQIAAGAPIAEDCKYCPFHMPKAADLSNGGCNGRR